MLGCFCPSPLSNGRTPSGASELAFDSGEIETVGAVVTTVVLARLVVVGASAHVNIETIGQQDNAENGAWSLNNASAARNAIGSNANQFITILSSYTDAAAPPWTTVAAGAWPAGWAFVAPAVVGTDFQIQFNGAAGQTIRWRVYGSLVLQWGAVAA